MIRTAIRRGTTRRGNGFSPATIFAAAGGAAGIWLEAAAPVDATQYQDNLGATAVTAINQTLGLWKDRRTASPINVLQATSTTRPTLQARVNLLTKSEQFDDSSWIKTNATVAANQVAAPNGTLTADLVYPTATGASCLVNMTPTGVTNNSYQSLIRAKAAGKTMLVVYNVQGNSNLYVDLTTGKSSNVGSNISGLVTSIDTNGWVTITFSSQLTSGTAATIYAGPCDASGSNSVTANGTAGVYLWGADVRNANDATLGYPVYQRVNTASDYDTAGLPYAARFDAVDDCLQSASFNAGSLSSDMDAFLAVKRATAGNGVSFSQAQSDAGNFFAKFQSGTVTAGTACAGVGTAWTCFVDGAQVGSGANTASADGLNTALTPGAWHVLEFRDLNMAAWTQLTLNGYSGFVAGADQTAIVLCPAQTNSVRQKLRHYCGQKVGLIL